MIYKSIQFLFFCFLMFIIWYTYIGYNGATYFHDSAAVSLQKKRQALKKRHPSSLYRRRIVPSSEDC